MARLELELPGTVTPDEPPEPELSLCDPLVPPLEVELSSPPLVPELEELSYPPEPELPLLVPPLSPLPLWLLPPPQPPPPEPRAPVSAIITTPRTATERTWRSCTFNPR
ncbi:hypothetical protein ACLGI4_16930 [Streptomyces sp. HMX112]|uniref:hypothetical protein n=1 Tax=Streptomyces sp. HMX112 TaxID=3390850 RepID=UPI003A81157E